MEALCQLFYHKIQHHCPLRHFLKIQNLESGCHSCHLKERSRENAWLIGGSDYSPPIGTIHQLLYWSQDKTSFGQWFSKQSLRFSRFFFGFQKPNRGCWRHQPGECRRQDVPRADNLGQQRLLSHELDLPLELRQVCQWSELCSIHQNYDMLHQNDSHTIEVIVFYLRL